MSINAPPERDQAAELSRQAFDFATRHPGHPLAEILRAKARALPCDPAAPEDLIELRLLVAQALRGS